MGSSFQVFVGNFETFLGLALAGFLPWLLACTIIFLLIVYYDNHDDGHFILALLSFAFIVVTGLTTAVSTLSLTKATDLVYHKKGPINVHLCLRTAVRHLVPYGIAGLLLNLVNIGILIVLYACIAAAIVNDDKLWIQLICILGADGMALLYVVWTVSTLCVAPAIVLDGSRACPAIVRAWKASKGRRLLFFSCSATVTVVSMFVAHMAYGNTNSDNRMDWSTFVVKAPRLISLRLSFADDDDTFNDDDDFDPDMLDDYFLFLFFKVIFPALVVSPLQTVMTTLMYLNANVKGTKESKEATTGEGEENSAQSLMLVEPLLLQDL